MTLFGREAHCDYKCPLCGGNITKLIMPINSQIFRCKACDVEFLEDYLILVERNNLIEKTKTLEAIAEEQNKVLGVLASYFEHFHETTVEKLFDVLKSYATYKSGVKTTEEV